MKPVEKKLICIGGVRDGYLVRDVEVPRMVTPEGEYRRFTFSFSTGDFVFYVADGVDPLDALHMMARKYVSRETEGS